MKKNKQNTQNTHQNMHMQTQTHNRCRQNRTEKTIEELKQSIGSIEKMIQKSQQILRNTKPLKPREARSDSLQLRLQFNSKEKSTEKKLHKYRRSDYQQQELTKLSNTTAAVTLPNFNSSSTTISQNPQFLNESNNYQKQYPSFNSHQRINSMSIKNKPQRSHLLIDTDNTSEASFGRSNNNNNYNYNGNNGANIFMHPASPVSAITRNYRDTGGFDDSFADSLQNPFNFNRRMRTQGVNDSYQPEQRDYYIDVDSIDRYSVQRDTRDMRDTRENKGGVQRKNKRNQGMAVKKIVLKRKKNHNLNLNYLKTMAELEHQSRTPKNKLSGAYNSTRVKPGQYSNFHINPQPCITKADIHTNIQAQKLSSSSRSPIRPPLSHNNPFCALPSNNNISNNSNRQTGCHKFNKQNKKSQLQQFYEQVRKYGFVERYLTYSQIGCIFQYLKKSAIPQHRWPLYVVDKVYQKMENISKVKA